MKDRQDWKYLLDRFIVDQKSSMTYSTDSFVVSEGELCIFAELLSNQAEQRGFERAINEVEKAVPHGLNFTSGQVRSILVLVSKLSATTEEGK